jgi:hypothetical protein
VTEHPESTASQRPDAPGDAGVAADDLTPADHARLRRAGESIGKGVAAGLEDFADGEAPVDDLPAMPPVDPPDNRSQMPDKAPEVEKPSGRPEA